MVGVTPARRGYEPHAATILSGEKQIAVAAYDKAIRKALSARSSVARCSGNKLQETDRQRATSACLRHRRLDRALREHEARARRTRAGACHRGVIGDTDPSFAYAQGWDAVHGTYEGLSLAINLRSDGLLVRRDVADPVSVGGGSTTGEGRLRRDRGQARGKQPGPRGFFGVITLDATHPRPTDQPNRPGDYRRANPQVRTFGVFATLRAVRRGRIRRTETDSRRAATGKLKSTVAVALAFNPT